MLSDFYTLGDCAESVQQLKMSMMSFKMSFSKFPFKNLSRNFGFVRDMAISSKAAAIRLFDDGLGMVKFFGNYSIASETLVAPVVSTLIIRLWKWSLAMLTLPKDEG